MDQLESMSQARSLLDNSVVEHKSKPPLRWIANWAGLIASSAILKVAFIEEDVMEEKATFGFKYKFYGWLWDTFWPIYEKYGTFYKLDLDMSGKEWDDYDENGVPYWEKLGAVDPDYNPWDFEDDNGDAFRVIS